MAAFTLATIIYLKNKKLGVISFIAATIIGIARVAANVHYPLDVISGLILGVTIGVFCDKIMFYARHHHSSPRGKNNRRK
jgi:membrane-associated phospholipid phosphatase